jgi:murein L,D-transpeptidase YafK
MSTRSRHAAVLALAVVIVAFSALPCAAVRLAMAAPTPAVKADKILVLKAQRRLILMRHGKPLKAFTVSLGRTPRGAKVRQGDGRTPEGYYFVDGRSTQTRFFRALRISYPNERDRDAARNLGVSPGGGIMIHGVPAELADMGTRHAMLDWTEGCIAVTNEEIEIIWDAVDDGTAVEIRP